MPELPEVETVRRSLEIVALGRKVREIVIKRTDLRYPIPAERIQTDLPGATLMGLERRGKVLVFRFKRGRSAERCLLGHLGMSGRFLATERAAGNTAWLKHEHVRLTMDTWDLRFIDPRRFGSIELCLSSSLTSHPRVKNLGVEPLSNEFDGDLLFQGTRRKQVRIRDFLLTGNLVAGVGNIYANEACFHSGVRPQRPVSRLSRPECQRLSMEIKKVLESAIDAGGSTLSDGGYVDGSGNSGWFQFSHWVYNRAGEACKRCDSTVKKVKDLKRSAFYCPKCQK
ncbi:MAG: bifunctional DNA-formamidopyrimidine glycosylase/DNA-(apurinic or apyrimidinic site) lyase [Planctomycetota bacterium]|nr:bifunctional DNA-formamidopyrimidine glycosylase/DNA-(apurinic or apyrimidinic site) lyase [Planctomycetota bacterium]